MATRIPDCHSGILYSFQVTATPGLTITSPAIGPLPSGLQWNSATGTITGTPAVLTSAPGDTDWAFTLSDATQWVLGYRNNIVLTTWTEGDQPNLPSTYTGFCELATNPGLSNPAIFQPCPYPQQQISTSTYCPGGSTTRLFTIADVSACNVYARLFGSLSGAANNDTPTQINQFVIGSIYIDIFYGDDSGPLPYLGGGSYDRLYPAQFNYIPANGFGCGSSVGPYSGIATGSTSLNTVPGFNVPLAPGTSNSWASFTAFGVGSIILDSNGNLQIATTPGTTGGTSPTWNTKGGVTTDGTVQWQGHGVQTFSAPLASLTMCCWHFNSLTNYTQMQWFEFASPFLNISCGSPPGGLVGISYNHLFPHSGGTLPYVFSITSGSLPTGLILNISTGTVTGIPTLVGTYAFTIQITDSTSATASVNCSITISAGGPWVIQEISAEFIPSKPYITGHGHFRYTVRCVNEAQAGTYLGFWASLGGGSSSGGGGSVTASGTAPGAPGAPPVGYETVAVNGTIIASEPEINFVNGQNVNITGLDDPTNGRVDVTINASGIGGVNLQTGTSYAVVAGDDGELVSIGNASPVAVSLPIASSLPAKFLVFVENTGAGQVTVTPTTSTVDGAANFTLTTNQWAAIFSDGTNYETVRGLGGTVTHTSGALTADQPVFGAGGADIKVGAKSGNTDELLSVSGTLVAGDFLTTDLSGNAIDSTIPTSILGNFATKLGVQESTYTYAADTGTANAYAVAITPTPTIGAGSVLVIKVLHANTGASTIATNGGSPIAVKKESSGGLVALASGDWQAGAVVICVNDGTIWQWVGGTWVPPNVGSIGGVNPQTTSYSAVSGDNGKLIAFNSATAVTLTLPGSPPSSTWLVAVTNQGAGLVTIGSTGIILNQNQSGWVWTDGTIYYFQYEGFSLVTMGITIDGGGAPPATGWKGNKQVPFNGFFVGWTMLGDQSGSAQVTVKKGTYSAYPTVSSIVASAPPAISSAQKATSTSLTGWTTAIVSGDVFDFNLDSVVTLTHIDLALQIIRT